MTDRSPSEFWAQRQGLRSRPLAEAPAPDLRQERCSWTSPGSAQEPVAMKSNEFPTRTLYASRYCSDDRRRTDVFELLANSSGARRGRLHTGHGIVETPAFMPVGTAASVKAMDPGIVEELGARQIVCNTYHLYLRPGHRLIRELGGLHRFMGWSGSILTDSGGYQVFSHRSLLQLSDEGALFRSHIDGSRHLLTPELSVEIQRDLGSDIAMVLDECPPYPCSEEQAQSAVARTTDWAWRSKAAFEALAESGNESQFLFAIVQGSVYRNERLRSLEDLLKLDLPGYAIGGLSVGEPPELMLRTLEWLVPEMAVSKPRYLMGVGRPIDILESVARGVDLFDCVLPTRLGRNGAAYTLEGRLNIKNSRFKRDEAPLEPFCDCSTCQRFSRAYLRHLFMSKEILAAILLTTHNLFFYLRLMKRVRAAIEEGCFSRFYEDLVPRLAEPHGN